MIDTTEEKAVNQVTTLSVREFTRNTHRHLKEGRYLITSDGEPKYEIEIKEIKDFEGNRRTGELREKKEFIAEEANIANYGCGCPKEEKKFLCSRHGRI